NTLFASAAVTGIKYPLHEPPRAKVINPACVCNPSKVHLYLCMERTTPWPSMSTPRLIPARSTKGVSSLMNTVGRSGRRSVWRIEPEVKYGLSRLQPPKLRQLTPHNMRNQTSEKPTNCYGLTKKPTA